MITFYWNTAPNPAKVALCLEEMGLPYEIIPIDTRKGDQHKPEFLAINPNAKVPAIVDDGETIFDSNAILLYLAEKTGKFLPAKPSDRGPMLSWLMFVASGIGPYSGQSVHFRNFAPEPKDYAVNRYTFEAQRHWGILDARLGKQKYMVGDAYGIVDMAVWGWSRLIPFVLGPEAPDAAPESAAPSRRDQRTAGGTAGERAEGQVHLQNRNGRGCTHRNVPASGEEGRLSRVRIHDLRERPHHADAVAERIWAAFWRTAGPRSAKSAAASMRS